MFAYGDLEAFIKAFNSRFVDKPFSNEALRALYTYHCEEPSLICLEDLYFNWQEDEAERVMEEQGIKTFEELAESTIVISLEADTILYMVF